MTIVVLFFVVIGVLILGGIIGPVISSFKISKTNLLSEQSYFTAESGIEDVFYRIKTNRQYNNSENLTLAGSSTTTTVTDISSTQKSINTTGIASSYERRVGMTLTQDSGVSFNYGVQVGQGGLSLSGSSRVNGNVYANGPIIGDGSSSITGSAISANSPAAYTDQTNGTGVPPTNFSFGNASNTDLAQSFRVSSTTPISKIRLYIRKVGNPSNATVYILPDSNGSPGTGTITNATLTASLVTTNYSWVDVVFSSNPALSVGTTYWIVVDTGNSTSNYYVVGANNGYADGQTKIGALWGSWGATNPSNIDIFFEIYLGGVYGSITGSSGSQWNQFRVGTSGTHNAQARIVNYTNATGTIYCQSGTGNNKSCNTSQSDPVYANYPISDANITEWKEDAESGGVHNGNFIVNGASTVTLGSKKINGNLYVSESGTLNLSGRLWVTGSIEVSGAGKIRLSPSYGSSSEIIVSDGRINISGSSPIQGSGTSGSYLITVSTSNCPINPNCYGAYAASISGAAGALVLYVPNGYVSLSGSARAKSIVGYLVSLTGAVSLDYESGLANLTFTSGPSGSWTPSGWGETQ